MSFHRGDSCGCCVVECPAPSYDTISAKAELCSVTAFSDFVGLPGPQFGDGANEAPVYEKNTLYHSLSITITENDREDYDSETYSTTSSYASYVVTRPRNSFLVGSDEGCGGNVFNGHSDFELVFQERQGTSSQYLVRQTVVIGLNYVDRLDYPAGSTNGTKDGSYEYIDPPPDPPNRENSYNSAPWGNTFYNYGSSSGSSVTTGGETLTHTITEASSGYSKSIVAAWLEPWTVTSAFVELSALLVAVPEGDFSEGSGERTIISYEATRVQPSDERVSSAILTLRRYHWLVPESHEGSWFKVKWNEVFIPTPQTPPAEGEPAPPTEPEPTKTPKEWIWDGSRDEDGKPEPSEWFNPSIPSGPGTVTLEDVRYACYQAPWGTPFFKKE